MGWKMAEPTAGPDRQASHHYAPYQPPPHPSYPYSTHPVATNDHYRPHPVPSNMALPSINLPPLRSLDPQSQSPPYQSSHLQSSSSLPPQPPPPPPPTSYYSQSSQPPIGHSTPPIGMSQQPYMQRYPLPAPNDTRLMSGGRHKKEIKRRTKTGCLTCRKRRIKVRRV